MVTALVWRLWRDEGAQELTEYAYLAMFIGIAGAVVWLTTVQIIAGLYPQYDSGVQGLSTPPLPDAP